MRVKGDGLAEEPDPDRGLDPCLLLLAPGPLSAQRLLEGAGCLMAQTRDSSRAVPEKTTSM